MKTKILNALREKSMSWKEISLKFGEESFEIMKELIETDKITSEGQNWKIK